ncbi:MAG: hypothetical protein V4539_01125 [Bacteroidota bacterium]
MEKYRRPDSEYYDNYDRRAIVLLKELEILEAQKLAAINDDDARHAQVVADIFTGQNFNDAAVLAYRNRTESVARLMKEDEERDRIINKTRIPPGPNCTTCMEIMVSTGHVLKETSKQVIFLFDCARGHAQRRALYSNGREHVVKTTCTKCGGSKVNSKKKETKKKIVFTDTCKDCGHVSILELDQTTEPPIDETERRKYLLTYAGKKTQQEEFHAFLDFLQKMKVSADEREAKELLELDKIEKLTTHQLQQRIIEAGKQKGFVGLQFDKPEISRDAVIIPFTMQENGNRKETESVDAFKRLIHALLLPTSWRLHKNKVEYRVGYLSGKLQGFEMEYDLIKIAAEILEAKKRVMPKQ